MDSKQARVQVDLKKDRDKFAMAYYNGMLDQGSSLSKTEAILQRQQAEQDALDQELDAVSSEV